MVWNFYFKSLLLGLGLSMDACAVSIVNGFNYGQLPLVKKINIAFIFAFFQGLMPLIGYFIGQSFLHYFSGCFYWISFSILLVLGVNMLIGANNNYELNDSNKYLKFKTIFFQSIATSIDALSAGLTIATCSLLEALICVLTIFAVTFIVCFIGVSLGSKFGVKLGNKAIYLGGIILVLISFQILVSKIF